MQMWYPQARRNEMRTTAREYTDKEMNEFIANGADNGWTIDDNGDGTVSTFKDGRYIRDYTHV